MCGDGHGESCDSAERDIEEEDSPARKTAGPRAKRVDSSKKHEKNCRSGSKTWPPRAFESCSNLHRGTERDMFARSRGRGRGRPLYSLSADDSPLLHLRFSRDSHANGIEPTIFKSFVTVGQPFCSLFFSDFAANPLGLTINPGNL